MLSGTSSKLLYYAKAARFKNPRRFGKTTPFASNSSTLWRSFQARIAVKSISLPKSMKSGADMQS